jgi:hypothetical protein
VRVRRLAPDQVDEFRTAFEGNTGRTLDLSDLTGVEIWGLYRGDDLIGGFTRQTTPASRFLEDIPADVRADWEFRFWWNRQSTVVSTNCIWLDRRFTGDWRSVGLACSIILLAHMPGGRVLAPAQAYLLALLSAEMGADVSSEKAAVRAILRPPAEWEEPVEGDGAPWQPGWSVLAQRPGTVTILARLVLALWKRRHRRERPT